MYCIKNKESEGSFGEYEDTATTQRPEKNHNFDRWQMHTEQSVIVVSVVELLRAPLFICTAKLQILNIALHISNPSLFSEVQNALMRRFA